MMWVQVKTLLKYCNPLVTPPWGSNILPISREEVQTRIHLGNLTPYREYNPVTLIPETKFDHINRIAWLVVNGWGDSAIAIDFNSNEWIIYDGNHRFAAAIIRNDQMIWAEVYGEARCIRALYET